MSVQKKCRTVSENAIAAMEAFLAEDTLTLRKYTLRMPKPTLTAAELKGVREALQLSQPLFAELLCVSPAAVKAWEQGQRKPQPVVCRLVTEIRSDLPRWKKRVKASLVATS